MGFRTSQVCGVWFWVAVAFFLVVVLNHSRNVIPLPAHTSPPFRSSADVPLTTSQRAAISEKAWQSSVSLRHKTALAHPLYPHIPLFQAQEKDEVWVSPYTLWDFFPATYTCPWDIQRIGKLGDGGKWICGMNLFETRSTPATAHRSIGERKEGKVGVKEKPINGKWRVEKVGVKVEASEVEKLDERTKREKTIIYSFGIDESSFENEMLSRIPSAEIYAFDSSATEFDPQLSSSYTSRVHFGQLDLGTIDAPAVSPSISVYTLQTLMAQNNHSYIDILKIDIRGKEYGVLDAFMDACEKLGRMTMPVGQVLIELYLDDDETMQFESFRNWWERLEGFGMRAALREVNLPAVPLGKGKGKEIRRHKSARYSWINSRDEGGFLWRA